MAQKSSFRSFLLVLIIAGLGYWLYELHKDNKKLFTLVDQFEFKRSATTEQKIVYKQVSAEAKSWCEAQSKIKDAVVQVFVQKALVDILQPFKAPTHVQSVGSGFFINQEGELITNHHVIDQARQGYIYINIPSLGKEQFPVEIVGTSPDRDLALLCLTSASKEKIKRKLGRINYLTFGDSDLVRRADEVMAVGFPLGQSLKFTGGIVSGRQDNLIQIDAPINPGSSGGPALNLDCEVVGINSSGIIEAQNVGYMIPSNVLTNILDDLRKVKLLKRPFLGVLYGPVTSALTDYLGNPSPGGLYVLDVYEDGPLHRAGIKKGDMIYQINGHQLDIYGELSWMDDKMSLINFIEQLKMGQKIKIVAYRNGERLDLDLMLDQVVSAPIRKIYPGYDTIDYEIIGMCIQELKLDHLRPLVAASPSLTKYAELKYQMKPALIITHIFNNEIMRMVNPGTIIKKVNGIRVRELDELRTALQESLKTGRVIIETNENGLIVLPLEQVLKEEQQNARDFYYQLTPGIKRLSENYIKQKEMEKKDEPKTAADDTQPVSAEAVPTA